MKRKKRSSRFALSMLFSVATFAILLVSVAVAGVIVYVLAHFHLLPFGGEGGVREIGLALLFAAFISTVVGMVLSVFVMMLPLAPISQAIAQMNRLAAGDFKARLHYKKPIGSHPSFIEAADSFNRLAVELDNTEMLRSDFINNFSHEFKTPIVSIAGFARLLKRGGLTDAQRAEYIDIIEEESRRLASMATNVLNLTKVENQQILTDTARFNLSEQLRSCVLLLEEKWAKKELSFELEFREYSITANEELLKQVWINLLDNAIKFSPRGGCIRIGVEESGGRLCVTVANPGPTIPEEQQERIFRKFYQGDESHAAEGNGIGLAIVRRVTELHRGSVCVENTPDGVAFTVTLPVG